MKLTKLIEHRLTNSFSSRNVLVAVAMVLIPFLPATGIVRVGFVIAERILYIPSIGYCILVCIGFDRIKQKYPQVRVKQRKHMTKDSLSLTFNFIDLLFLRYFRVPGIHSENESTGYGMD